MPALVIGVVYIPYVAKPIRAQVLTLREREFVDAARQQGLGPMRIMFSEILPNLSSTIIVFVPLILANAILLEAGLSYLGAGVQPPNASWGTMISDGVHLIPAAIHLTIVPGVMLVLCVLGINVFGDGLRDALDPRAKVKVRLAENQQASVESRSAMDAHTDGRFVVRRLLSCLALLFAISILTFLIFEAMPNGNPALRLAGRTATQVQIDAVEREWGFNKPIYVQYLKTMEKILTGKVVSYTQGINVEHADRLGPPADPLAGDRRGDHLVLLGRRLRRARGGPRRALARSRAHRAVADRRLDAGLLPRRDAQLLPRVQGGDLSQRRLRQHHDEPGAVALPHDPAVVRAVGACSSASTRACCARRSSTW